MLIVEIAAKLNNCHLLVELLGVYPGFWKWKQCNFVKTTNEHQITKNVNLVWMTYYRLLQAALTLERMESSWLLTSCASTYAVCVSRSRSSADVTVCVTRELNTFGLRRFRRECASEAWITVRCFNVLVSTEFTSSGLNKHTEFINYLIIGCRCLI